MFRYLYLVQVKSFNIAVDRSRPRRGGAIAQNSTSGSRVAELSLYVNSS